MPDEVAIASLESKKQALYANLRSAGRLMVAYSGGTDSAYLAYAAHQVLGAEMLAVIADSPSLSRAHLRDAVDFAKSQGIPLRVIDTHELEDVEYVRNDSSRCFHCKDELFKVMSETGGPLQFTAVAYGMNADDRGDFRPGQKAAANHKVLAPLAEVGLTKEEIRTLAREAGLRVWDKPASACLSSRIAYGLPVTRETLESIEKGEEVLFSMGFRQFRVRHHGELVRIEIAREELARMLSLAMFEQASAALKRLGYKYVTLDLEGYRSGSMNALLPISEIGLIGAKPSTTSDGVN
ncbi:ATP-dependent sacrificial sulfur transferase LarE [Acidicapsa acidisoli]|uniref:ATP-dependent sacrificial sulfur transferase LarE n=1 Tax=Acidicapsa acidisoli TaxID=1615681 RepID=UPI0021DFE983|nr:ATP-dependent sacrificial sulfur transferase LarE [Acidicapsa acidisoli]